jgi:hypothetical protein
VAGCWLLQLPLGFSRWGWQAARACCRSAHPWRKDTFECFAPSVHAATAPIIDGAALLQSRAPARCSLPMAAAGCHCPEAAAATAVTVPWAALLLAQAC